MSRNHPSSHPGKSGPTRTHRTTKPAEIARPARSGRPGIRVRRDCWTACAKAKRTSRFTVDSFTPRSRFCFLTFGCLCMILNAFMPYFNHLNPWRGRSGLYSLREGIRIVDRIAGKEALNDFLNPEERRTVSVASNDGQSGDIDVYKRMTAQNPEYIDLEDYKVALNETLEIDDV
jgi:hypothetical protein